MPSIWWHSKISVFSKVKENEKQNYIMYSHIMNLFLCNGIGIIVTF